MKNNLISLPTEESTSGTFSWDAEEKTDDLSYPAHYPETDERDESAVNFFLADVVIGVIPLS